MRIVAGEWRGRPLAAPAGHGTRPTSDRVREGVFDALVARLGTLEGVSVLDPFAGTGAMGLEALSRGAARAVFVESGRGALAALEQNIVTLRAGDRAVVIEGDAGGRALERALAHGPFSLLVLDPPYRIERSVPLSLLERAGESLTGNALLVWEHQAGDVPEPPGWDAERTYRYGDTEVTFLTRRTEGEGS